MSVPAIPAAASGPVPDYAPMAAVLSHAQLSEVAPELVTALNEVLGPVHRVESYDPGTQDDQTWEEDTSLLWMRDFQLLYVRRPDGGLEGLRYLAFDPNRADYLPEPLPSAPAVPVRWLPLLHENGNLLVAGRFIFVSERLLKDNAQDYPSEHLKAAGYKPRGADEVLAVLAHALYREVEELVVFPTMPGEQTGHVDMFLLPLDERRVVVPSLSEEAITALATPSERANAQTVQRFLDEQAAKVAALGLEVLRVPMLPPLTLPAIDTGELELIYFSPANSLLLRTEHLAVVLIPELDELGLSPEIALLQRQYRREWRALFTAQGFRARLVDATDLGRYLGLFRCVTALIPPVSLGE